MRAPGVRDPDSLASNRTADKPPRNLHKTTLTAARHVVINNSDR
jgi:hypothetical protein